MAQKASESLRSGELTIEPNHYHNQWFLWLDNIKYKMLIFYFYTSKVQINNIILEIGVYLDNSGGVIDYQYMKQNMVGFLHTAQKKLLKKLVIN